MRLLNEAIGNLAGDKPNVTEALMKTKVILHDLGRKDLVGWVNLELSGYPKDVEVPAYRIVRGTVRGALTNGFQRYADVQLPTLHLDVDRRKRFEAIEIRDSIMGLELLAKKDDGQLSVPIAPEFRNMFKKGISSGFEIERAWSDIGLGVIAQITTEVRSRLLDFLLELSGRVTDDMNEAQLKQVGKSVETASMFNNAVFGPNATIIVGNHNTQNVRNQVQEGDFESLATFLGKYNVAPVQISELREALNADAGATELAQKQFGPRVRDWIARMYAKALDTSWVVEVSIAANLLTDSLKAHYGWLVQ